MTEYKKDKDVAVFNRRKPALGTLTVVWSLYAVACLVPAIDLKTGAFIGHGAPGGPVPGWFLLFPGVVIVACLFNASLWPLAWAWLANPVLVVGSVLLLYRKGRSAIVAAMIAIVLSVGCWMPVYEVDRLRVGYYLWVASMSSLAIGAWFTRRATIRQASAPV